MDIEQQYDKLLRYCYMKLGDRSLAEDVTQDTFIRFFESTTYHSAGKEMAYLYTIARNLCSDCFRKHKEEQIEKMPELSVEDDRIENTIERICIDRAMSMLSPDEREIIGLRFIAELPIGDIAKTFGISRFAVSRRVSSALRKLRKELSENEEF